MKNRMLKRKTIKKISSFLRGIKGKTKIASKTRRMNRNPNPIPNSNKVGAGNDNTSVIRNFIVSNKTYKRKNVENKLKHVNGETLKKR